MAISEITKTNIRQLSGVANTEAVISELEVNSEKVKDIETCVPQDTEVVSLEGVEPCAPTSITPEEAKAARDKDALDIKQKLRGLIGVDKLVKMGMTPLLTQVEIDEYQAEKDLCERNCLGGIRTVVESNRAEELAAQQEYSRITSEYLRKYAPGLFLMEFYLYVLTYFNSNSNKKNRRGETALNSPINELNIKLNAIRNSIDETETFYSPIANSMRELFLKRIDSCILATSTSKRSPRALTDASARLGTITIPNGVGVEEFGKIISDIQSQAYAIANIDDIVTTTAALTGISVISTGPVAQQSQLGNITLVINTTVSDIIRQIFQLMTDKLGKLTDLSQLIMDTTPTVIDTGLQTFGDILDFSLQQISGNYPGDYVKLRGTYDEISKIPTVQEITSGNPVEIRRNNINAHITSRFEELLDEYQQFANDVALVAASVLIEGTNLNSLMTQFDAAGSDVVDSIKGMIYAFEVNDMDYKRQRLVSKLSTLSCCGKPLINPGVDIFGPATNTATNDVNWNTFEESGQPQLTELDYWKSFATVLNQVALLPVHYSIGLIVPSPGGPVNVPLPVIWYPVVAIKNPATLTVVFVTINGMVFSPVIWQLRWKPIADAESVHVTLFRGANASIKTGTGTKILNPPIVGGIDTAPEVHKLLPFEKDDIPTIERIRNTNAPFLLYLNSWCSTAKPGMGLL